MRRRGGRRSEEEWEHSSRAGGSCEEKGVPNHPNHFHSSENIHFQHSFETTAVHISAMNCRTWVRGVLAFVLPSSAYPSVRIPTITPVLVVPVLAPTPIPACFCLSFPDDPLGSGRRLP